MRAAIATSLVMLVGCGTPRPEGAVLMVPGLSVPAEDLARHHVEGVGFELQVPAEVDEPVEPSEATLLIRAD